MLIVILILVLALIAWSLHLMQEAFSKQEFSLMLAGTLVAMSAVAMLFVYFIVNNCVGYLTRIV
jgi:uncharacterized membrane protein YcjF (UPF0283 family)